MNIILEHLRGAKRIVRGAREPPRKGSYWHLLGGAGSFLA